MSFESQFHSFFGPKGTKTSFSPPSRRLYLGTCSGTFVGFLTVNFIKYEKIIYRLLHWRRSHSTLDEDSKLAVIDTGTIPPPMEYQPEFRNRISFLDMF